MTFTATNQPHHVHRSPALIAALRAEWAAILAEAGARCEAETGYDPDEIAENPWRRGRALRQLGLPAVPDLAAKYVLPRLTCRLILDGLIHRVEGGAGRGRTYPPAARAALVEAVCARPETGESIHRIAARLSVTPGVVVRAIRASRTAD